MTRRAKTKTKAKTKAKAPATARQPDPGAEVERGAGVATDLANALRLARAAAGELLHAEGLGWLAWDGRRWRPSRAAAEAVAQRVPAAILDEASAASRLAAQAGTEAQRAELAARAEALIRWARQSAMAPRIAAAMRLAEPHLAVEPDRLDADPWALNCQNGTVDLRTGELRPHRRDDLITRLCPVDHDPGARAPEFEALVEWAMLGRKPLVRYLQLAAGYSACGSNREQCLLFAYGSGANGKSTILGAIRDALGTDYADDAPPDLLTAAQGERHATELADLRGRRMILCSETEKGRRLAVQRMKQITGESRIKARRMREDFASFDVTVTPWLLSNNRPEVAEHTRAVWRRIRVIPFEATVEREDRRLPERLRAERPGILAWIVRGAAEWQRDGLGTPPEVEAAVADYRQASDTLGAFIAACCDVGDQHAAPAAELFSAYRAFCDSEGARPLDRSDFKLDMVARGHGSRKTKAGWLYHGLRVSADHGDSGRR